MIIIRYLGNFNFIPIDNVLTFDIDASFNLILAGYVEYFDTLTCDIGLV